MKARAIAEFACELNKPQLFVDPCHDDDNLRTMHGVCAYDSSLQQLIRETIGQREPSERINFKDTDNPLDHEWILDRFLDVTNGIDPGNHGSKTKRMNQIPL